MIALLNLIVEEVMILSSSSYGWKNYDLKPFLPEEMSFRIWETTNG